MAETPITPTVASNSLPGAVVALETGGDAADGNSFIMAARNLLIVSNPDVSDHHIAISSVNDEYGRPGDKAAETIAAGGIAVFYCEKYGWASGGSLLLVTPDDASLVLGLVQLPH